MNTLTKGFAKRVISMLLVTIMVFSLGIVGLTSVSAANTELAETGWGSSDVMYCRNNIGGWSDNNNTKMTWTSDGYHQLTFNDVKTNQDIYFRIHAPYNQTMSAKSNDLYIKPTYGSDTALETVFDNSGNTQNNWKIWLGDYSTYDTVDVYIKVYTEYGGKSNVVVVYIGGGQKTTTINSVSVSASGVGTTNDKVTLTATSNITNQVSPIYKFYVQGPNDSNYLLKQTSSAKTYQFTPSVAGTYKYYVNVSDNGKNKSSTAKSFTVNPAVTFTKVEATKGTEGLTGSASTINYDYAVTGSQAEPSSIKLLLNGTEFGGNYTVDKANKTITFTPTTANSNYLFSVAITIDGVTGTTNEVSYNIRDPYKATLSVEGDNAIYKGQGEFTLKVSDNSDQYGTPSYALYKDGVLIQGGNNTGVFTVSADTVGTSEYYVEADVSGDVPAKGTTNTVKLTVKDTVFSVYLTAPKSTMEDHEFAVTANVEFPPADATLVYELKGSDGKTYTSNNGQFTVVADCPEDKESVDVTYTVTVYAKGADGSLISTVTDTAKVTITKDHGVYPIRILFKCSDTYGYLPNMKVKVNGNDAEDIARQKYAAIESRPNATDTATYSWYYYEIPDVDYGTDIVFSANATRNYFYNASITIKAGQGDFVQDGTFYCYYLALENLNGGTNVLSNISALDEAHRNWTASAVNMIYDDADAHLPVGVNFAYANMNDANTDGKVNVKDATYIQKSLANIVEASALSTAVSDVNNDGKVTIKDATALQKQIAGL